jgi:hypothetical protein
MTATDTPTHVDPPRDRWGRYEIPNPDTGKVEPYTRATTFAKAISDTFGLTKWMLRMGGLGLAQRKDLLAGLAAADPSDSRTLDRIMAEAKEHAGASSGANIGTAIHRFTELIDAGESPDIPEPWDADVAAYVAAVQDAGLTILPEFIETVVVIPSLQVAGTLDRIVKTSDGRMVIADLKTGKSVDYSMGEIAVQLALYANATHTFDPATGQLAPMPDVDKTQALVFHAPAGTGTCHVLSVDITAGAEMFDVIQVVRDWRKRRDLAVPYSPQSAASPLQPDPADQLAWLTRALHQLDEWGQLGAVAQAWPQGVPTLRQAREDGVELTSPQLDAIFRAIVDVAARAKLDFDLFDPPYPGQQEMLLPTDPRITELRSRLERLPADLAEVVAGLSGAAGVPKLSSGKATVAHAMIVATHLDDAEAQMRTRRSMAAAHLGEFPGDAQPAALRLAGVDEPDLLTAQAADRLGVLADALALGIIACDGADVLVGEGAEAALLKIYGTKRPLLDAAKEAAKVLGLARPTSSQQVLSDPMLLAATFIEGQPTSETGVSS